MKYEFSVYVCGKKLSSKPLTREELDETIRVYLNNGVMHFEVKELSELNK